MYCDNLTLCSRLYIQSHRKTAVYNKSVTEVKIQVNFLKDNETKSGAMGFLSLLSVDLLFAVSVLSFQP